MSDLIVLHPSDDVAVVLRASGLSPGEAFEAGGRSGTVHSKVPRGHKLALRDLAAGAEIRKYGLPIAVATQILQKLLNKAAPWMPPMRRLITTRSTMNPNSATAEVESARPGLWPTENHRAKVATAMLRTVGTK